MQNVQRIVLVDFGAQYTQLIARRVREANVFCEVVSYLTPLSEILDKKPVGIILSGGPASVLDADAYRPGHLRAGHPGAGHLLRHAADGLHPRRHR